jgi:hypothetical protein
MMPGTFSVMPLRRGGLLLGYAGTTSAALRDGVQRLARVLRGVWGGLNESAR